MIDYSKNPMEDEIYSDNPTVMFLEHDMIDGFKYFIVSYSSHPCAYVEIPKGHKLFGMHYDDVQWEYGVYAYGGLTYSRSYLRELKDRWFIGWDYAHSSDFYNVPWRDDDYGKKHSLDEIRQEVAEVIRQIKALEDD